MCLSLLGGNVSNVSNSATHTSAHFASCLVLYFQIKNRLNYKCFYFNRDSLIATCLGKSFFIRFTAHGLPELLSIYVHINNLFSNGFENGIWVLILLIMEHCLSIYFS